MGRSGDLATLIPSNIGPRITSAGGQAIQVPVQTLVDVPAGIHTAGLAVSARYDLGGPGDVLVSGVSVIAGAFPADPVSTG